MSAPVHEFKRAGEVVDLAGETLRGTVKILADRVLVKNGTIDADGNLYCIDANNEHANGDPVRYSDFENVRLRGATSKLWLAWWSRFRFIEGVLEDAADFGFIACDGEGLANVEIRDFAVMRTRPPKDPLAHADLIQCAGGSGIAIINPATNISCEGWVGSSSIFLKPTFANIDKVRVVGGQCRGGGWGLHARNDPRSSFRILPRSIDLGFPNLTVFEALYGPVVAEPGVLFNNGR